MQNAKHKQHSKTRPVLQSLKYIQTQFHMVSNHQHLRHGGVLRNKRLGRGSRTLSCKDSLHVVFKINRIVLKTQSLRTHRNFKLSHEVILKYANRFFVKIEQISIQGDHIHCLVRTSRRSFFHNFFRVASGQIAQQFEKTDKLRVVSDERFSNKLQSETKSVTDTPKVQMKSSIKRKLKLWKYRPFSRVVRGYKAYKIVRNYIQLNEKEATGEISYKKNRLRGLSIAEWELLWV